MTKRSFWLVMAVHGGERRLVVMHTVTEQCTVIQVILVPAAIPPGYAKRVTLQRNLTEHVNWVAVLMALTMLVIGAYCYLCRLIEAVLAGVHR